MVMSSAVSHVLPDPATEFGDAVRKRLRSEQFIWLTTVNGSGAPQPVPVWFLWQEEDEWGDGRFLIYHVTASARAGTLRVRPRVSLHFNGSADGDSGIVVFTGIVEIVPGGPRPEDVPSYAEKYAAHVAALTSNQKTLAEFLSPYGIVTHIRPSRVRGH
jgi:PPOX class probable F420-dependent enzyme